MRRMYQAPLCVSISRSIGAWVRSTVWASARRASSTTSELRSASGRPTSLGMTLKSSLLAGVKKRMLRLVSRKSVATSVLHKTFFSSLYVVCSHSSVSRSSPLRAVSSLFSVTPLL